MQILIFGMHRAGTSMTTRLVNMMGAYVGPETSLGPIKPENPKGFWERPEVLKINDALLQLHGCTWSDLKNWKSGDLETIPRDIEMKMKHLLLGMDAFRPWVLKDPRMCLLFPYWRPYLEVPVAVIVHRSPHEIALSLHTRNNFPLEFGIALWEYYTVNLLNATRHLPRAYVRYTALHEKPIEACQNLYNQLTRLKVRRLEMPHKNEINAFIDPSLYRSKQLEPKMLELTPFQKSLVEILRNRKEHEQLHVSEESKLLMLKQQV